MNNENIKPGELIVLLIFSGVLSGKISESDIFLFRSRFIDNNDNYKERLFSYFENIDEPFLRIKEIIGFSLKKDIHTDEEILNGVRSFDKKGFSFIDRCRISDESHELLNSACALYMIGANRMANNVAKVAGRTILHDAFKVLIEEADVLKKISDINRDNASGPKKDFYKIAVKIMRDTWEKYPKASKNGMTEKLSYHFGPENLSKSSVIRWIKAEKLGPTEIARPPISFSLVIKP